MSNRFNTDRISFGTSLMDYIDTIQEPALRGWRLDYDSAWRRDIVVGDTITITSHFGGYNDGPVTLRVEAVDCKQGIILQDIEGMIFP